MAHGQFIVSDTNPNDTHGGGGCVCDPRKQIDCTPPYIICFAGESRMLDDRSPHVVVCQTCVNRMATMLQGEALSAGERGQVVPGQPVQVLDGPENPEVDDEHLIDVLKHRDEATPDI